MRGSYFLILRREGIEFDNPFFDLKPDALADDEDLSLPWERENRFNMLKREGRISVEGEKNLYGPQI